MRIRTYITPFLENYCKSTKKISNFVDIIRIFTIFAPAKPFDTVHSSGSIVN